MHIGRNIRFLRKKFKITQTELAERIDKKKTVISSYENDHSEPPISVLVKLAAIFNVSIDDFVHTDLSNPKATSTSKSRMKKSSLEYAQDIEHDRMTVDELEAEIGQINMQKVFRLMELRINELEMALQEENPELAKRLKIE